MADKHSTRSRSRDKKVYIEDRVAELEKSVKSLQEQLSEMVESSDKKRKLSQVTQEQLDKAMEDAQRAADEKLGGRLEEAIAKALESVKAEVAKKISEDRLMQFQLAIDQKVSGVATREQLAQSMQAMTAAGLQKVSRDQLTQAVTQAVQNIQANLTPKVQASLNASEGLRLNLQETRNHLNQLQAKVATTPNGGAAAQWKDIDLGDMSPFDVFCSYRVRIGDGANFRWLYSIDVSMGQIYTSCNILDQAIVINANNKGSYGARRVGADVTTTTFFAVLQLQSRGP